MMTTKTPIFFTLSALTMIAVGSLSQAATIVHRYEFNDNVNDSVGSVNGTPSTATTNLEAPSFSTDAPGSLPIGAPTKSLDVGINDGTKKSGFGLSNAIWSDAGSISMWVNPDSFQSGNYFMTANNFILLSNGTGFNYGNGFGGDNLVGATADLTSDPANAWYHLVATWDNTNDTASLYLDGNLVNTITDATNDVGGNARVGSFQLSDDGNKLDNQFDGRLYDLQVYDSVLTESEATFLANNAGVVVPEPSSLALLALSSSLLIARRRRA